MDVTTLMFGDWLHCITDNTYCQFGRITKNSECHCDINGHLNFNYDIEPVPITGNFLLKNGFVQDGKDIDDNALCYSLGDGKTWFLEWWEKGNAKNAIANYSIDGGPKVQEMPCNTVDELQRILRMVGHYGLANSLKI